MRFDSVKYKYKVFQEIYDESIRFYGNHAKRDFNLGHDIIIQESIRMDNFLYICCLYF